MKKALILIIGLFLSTGTGFMPEQEQIIQEITEMIYNKQYENYERLPELLKQIDSEPCAVLMTLLNLDFPKTYEIFIDCFIAIQNHKKYEVLRHLLAEELNKRGLIFFPCTKIILDSANAEDKVSVFSKLELTVNFANDNHKNKGRPYIPFCNLLKNEYSFFNALNPETNNTHGKQIVQELIINPLFLKTEKNIEAIGVYFAKDHSYFNKKLAAKILKEFENDKD